MGNTTNNKIQLSCEYVIAPKAGVEMDEKGKYPLAHLLTYKRFKRIQNLSNQQARTIQKKTDFLLAYERTVGNVRLACKPAGIKSTKTFYNWCDNDPDFKKAVSDMGEMQRDFVADLLWMKILQGHGPSIRYYLSRRHPDYILKRITVPSKKRINPWAKWENLSWDDIENKD